MILHQNQRIGKKGEDTLGMEGGTRNERFTPGGKSRKKFKTIY